MKRLLVLDDDPAFVRFVERTAKTRGFAVRIAKTDDDFRNYVLTEAPDLIVLGTPEMQTDALEIAEWLCKQAHKGRLLAISTEIHTYAKGLSRVAQRSDNLHVEVLTKPMSEAMLIGILDGQPSGTLVSPQERHFLANPSTGKHGRD